MMKFSAWFYLRSLLCKTHLNAIGSSAHIRGFLNNNNNNLCKWTEEITGYLILERYLGLDHRFID